ncbi:MAG: LPS assembly protein LptD [Roseibacillus sp.]|nr:LPS assembly protein LptD [Roseibacillus sp.]
MNDQAPTGAIVALFCALVVLTSPPSPGQEVDPPPTGEELLTIPEGDGPGAPGNPFTLVPAMPKNLRIIGENYETKWDMEKELILYQGNMQCRTNNGIQLFADNIVINLKEKFVRFTGNVAVYQGAILHRGKSATYWYEKERLEGDGLRIGMGPILLEADKFQMVESNGRTLFVGEDAGVTTHDNKEPAFWLRAARTTVIPDDKVIFRDMKIYAGDKQIFWLPYLAQPLNTELGYHVIPGARSNWGPYLLNRYGLMLGGDENPRTGERRDAWLLSQWHLDLLTRRGIGTGADFLDTRLSENENLGWLKLYHIHDFDSTLNRSGIQRQNVPENRFRVQLRHRLQLQDLIPGGTSHLDANLTYLSDRFYLEDYDPSTFRVEPNPENILALTHQRERNLLTLWTRLRPNSFYQADTRLPEFALDQIRHPIFNTPVLHEGQLVAGLYSEHIPDLRRQSLKAEADALQPGDPRISEIETILSEHGYARLHLWQELSLPMRLDNQINLVPRAGLGSTTYRSVDGLGENEERTHIYAGIDASVKFSRSFPEVQNDALGLDSLLHVIQPYAGASWVATNELDSSFPRINRLTASTRPRPLGIGRFTAVDDIKDWTIIRLGVRNRFLTRRDGGNQEWLTINSYFDWFQEDPEFDREFSNFYNEIYFHPVPWLEIGLETQLPLLSKVGDFTEAVGSFRFMPSDSLELTLRHRFLNDHPILQDSVRFEYGAFKRFNKDWGAGFSHRWELDDNVLEYQQYSAHRTFENWVISLGIFHRNHRYDNEFGAMIGFTLREFPSINLPFKMGAN